MVDADQVKFVLRLPPTLHRKIKRRAKSNNTSMNKEITNILAQAVAGSSTDQVLHDLISRLEARKVI